MKVNLRTIVVPALSLAMVAGVATTATAASAATTPTAHVSKAASSSSTAGTITSTVNGTFTNAAGTGTFAGTFVPSSFSVVNGVLEATGVLKGTLTSANGTSLGSADQTVTIPVDTPSSAAKAAAVAGCNVLNLTLGPLDLNLLGLVVTLNQVNLVITAVPGAGNLLGNLLCDVANLLDGGGLSGLLGEVATLLNEILALL